MRCMYHVMPYEREETKDRANTIKHGFDFETARRIFGDPVLTCPDRRRDCGEARHVSTGRVEAAVLVVAHTVREG